MLPGAEAERQVDSQRASDADAQAEMSAHHNRDILNIYSDIEHSILCGIPGMRLMDVYVWNRVNPSKRLMFGSYPYPRNLYAQNTVEFVGALSKRAGRRRLTSLRNLR